MAGRLWGRGPAAATTGEHMHSLDESMYSVESTCSRPLRALCLAKAVDLALYRPSLSARVAAGYVHVGLLVFGTVWALAPALA